MVGNRGHCFWLPGFLINLEALQITDSKPLPTTLKQVKMTVKMVANISASMLAMKTTQTDGTCNRPRVPDSSAWPRLAPERRAHPCGTRRSQADCAQDPPLGLWPEPDGCDKHTGFVAFCMNVHVFP